MKIKTPKLTASQKAQVLGDNIKSTILVDSRRVQALIEFHAPIRDRAAGDLLEAIKEWLDRPDVAKVSPAYFVIIPDPPGPRRRWPSLEKQFTKQHGDIPRIIYRLSNYPPFPWEKSSSQ